eukprot:COSAG01_NODE_8447_length_2783_cov_1.686662_4_plen_103_part_00
MHGFVWAGVLSAAAAARNGHAAAAHDAAATSERDEASELELATALHSSSSHVHSRPTPPRGAASVSATVHPAQLTQLTQRPAQLTQKNAPRVPFRPGTASVC